MSAPAISIVLPTYNGSRYLGAAIESCLSQNCTDWELIIVDDASSDDTPAVIAEYLARDSRIRQVRHETNRKLPAALNTGFSLARGAFFTWTSDDNCYEPEALAAMLERLLAEPACGIVYTDYALIDERSEVTAPLVTVKDPCHMVFGNVVGPCFLYRRQVHEAISGFDEGLFLVEDYDFWLRASIHFPMLPLHENLYRYRMHGGSLTAKRQQEITAAHKTALLRSINQMTWLSRRARVLGVIGTSRLARARGDWKGANGLLAQAVKMAPLTAALILLKMMIQGPDIIYTLPVETTATAGQRQ